MPLPNLSNSMYVAQLRYIQSIYETPEHRNPDTLVRHFLPLLERLRLGWMSRKQLSNLRSDPFYYYLIARTRYYDRVFSEGVADGAQRILSVGCGSDTRSYRFEDLIRARSVRVIECDQPEAIQAKQRMAERRWRFDYVHYLPIDLNDEAWPELERRLGDRNGPKTLVVIEGVSPYVNGGSFRNFLQLLSTRLAPGSRIAYDFKLSGVKEDFGRAGRTEIPFRLSGSSDEVEKFHQPLGLRVNHLERSSGLCARLLPAVAKSATPLFEEDGLVRLEVGGV